MLNCKNLNIKRHRIKIRFSVPSSVPSFNGFIRNQANTKENKIMGENIKRNGAAYAEGKSERKVV